MLCEPIAVLSKKIELPTHLLVLVDQSQSMQLKDAWKDAVLDSLPEDATPRQKAEAFADAIVSGFEGKKEKALANEWDRRKKMIAEFESRFPDLHERIVDAYETSVMALQEDRAA